MRKLLISWFLLSSAAVYAEELPAPTTEELKKVIRYYYEGKSLGPILIEVKACTRIDFDKSSPTKHECLEEVKSPVARGTHVHAWTLWTVPEGGQYDDAAIQYVHEGTVKASIDLNLTPSLRSRAFRANALSKAGQWEIRVVRQGKVLGSVSFVAN